MPLDITTFTLVDKPTSLKESLAMAGKYTLHGNSQRKWSSQNQSRGTVL